jgi:membrane-bound serine protease (ClpP class)
MEMHASGVSGRSTFRCYPPTGWEALIVRAAIILAFSAVLGRPGLAGALEQRPRVDLLAVNDAIDPINAQYVQRGLKQAAGDGAGIALVELNTPGGLDSAMRQITSAMLTSPVPVVVYVTPSGARAGSAGVFIVMAADVAAMAPGTNVGAAHPVDGSGDNLSSDERDKVTNDAAAYIRTLATTRHHNAEWADQAVRQSVSLSADEALKLKVVDLIAPDRSALLSALDGRTVDRGGAPVQLHTRDAVVVPIEMTIPEQLLHLIDDPNIAYLLLTLGFWALIAELFHPGSILPGVVGVLCLALALTALQSLPLNWTGLALLAVALGLFIVDLKAPTHGALSAAAAATFIVGSLMLFAPVATPLPTDLLSPYTLGVSPALIALLAIGFVLFFVVAVRATLRARHRPAMVLLPVAPGATGVATTDLQPTGRVRVKGEEWAARSSERSVARGEPVQVVERQGLRLIVRPADGAGQDGR